MKRCICLVLTLCLLLCACGGNPPETTAPPEHTPPAQTTAPSGPAAPADTTAPAETTLPPETTLPSEPPAEDGSYTIRITDPDTEIYAGPAFRHGGVALVEEAGVYTIVEEATDTDGNRWGRLKSGVGWLCLTDPALAPIHAGYAEETFNAYYAYWSDETDYITSIGFTPAEELTDVSFTMLAWTERGDYQVDQELYTIDAMDPDRPFLAQVVFYGDMTTYGISFTDADGEVRHYAIMVSGKDGSLVCTEYVP